MTEAARLGALLQEARDAWALDNEDLAARASVTAEELQAALQGTADAADLDAVAHALGGTLDELIQGYRFWELPALAFKSAVGFERSSVRAALLRLSLVARDREGLRVLLGIQDPVVTRDPCLTPTALADDVATQAEELAGEVRRLLGNGKAPLPSVREVMHQLGVWTFLTDFSDPQVDGMLWREANGRVCAAANVGARRGKLAALRMTFAHELCHALFDGTRGVPMGLVEHRSERGVGIEQRANAFAAYLLAPRAGVREYLTAQGLAEGVSPSAIHVLSLSQHFGLGVEAVSGHLVSCGLWSPRAMRAYPFLKTRDAVGEDNAELHVSDVEDCVPIERRGALLTLATSALEQGHITVARWRSLLGLTASSNWRGLVRELEVTRDIEHRTAL